jgi:hypothetical protein
MDFGPSHPEYDRFSTIYIDESSQTQHRYLFLGGVVVPTRAASEFEDAISRARLPELPAGEMGWSKVSNAKLAAYLRVVDLFFENPSGIPNLDFHCLCIDTTRLDHRAYNAGSREIGFNKEVYNLAMKFARLYPGRLFHVYPDHRSTASSPEELRLILNRGAARHHRRPDWPFRRLAFRNSAEVHAIQLVDVLLGAVAYRRNAHHAAPGASPAKIALSAHVLAKAGIADVAIDTPMRGKFTIWNRVLRETSRSPRPQGSPS